MLCEILIPFDSMYEFSCLHIMSPVFGKNSFTLKASMSCRFKGEDQPFFPLSFVCCEKKKGKKVNKNS